MAGRRVRMVLCDDGGQVIGALPILDLNSSWWSEMGPVVEAARTRHGVELHVLRLLDGPSEPGEDGVVTYLGEVVAPLPADVPLDHADLPELVDEPLRLPWARPGGVRALVDWADRELGDRGLRRTGPARQTRAWNLSAVLELPTSGGSVWCKAIPPFFAHEGAAIALLAAEDPELLPPLLAHDHGRVLLAHVPGEDQHDPDVHGLRRLVRRFVALQARWIGRDDELLATGMPDWRTAALTAALTELAGRPEIRGVLSGAERADLAALVTELPDRFDELARTGLPDTLVHGDLHPGNTRSDGATLVVLDWGDSGVGHPLLDEPALLERAPSPAAAATRAAWTEAWHAVLPASDPARAMDLIAPIAALRQALIYRAFLDGIEPVERRYHRGDVEDWLRAALARR
jgi:hypothetical protein